MAVFVAAGVVVVGWSLTGEVNASNKSLAIGQALVDTQPQPLDWIDRATHGAPTTYVGQSRLRTPEILSLAFWNDSVDRMVTLGGEPIFGLIFETKIASADGRLSDPEHADFVVSDDEVDVAGLPVASAKRWNLERVDGPVRVNAFEAGIWQDGWQEETSAYTRFNGIRSGHVRVALSQQNGCDPAAHPRAEVRVVELARQRGVAVRRVAFPACQSTTVTVPVPRPPFAVRTRVTPTSRPQLEGPAPSRRPGDLHVQRYRALSRSGCLRTKRSMPRQCQSVRRVNMRRSVSRSQRWRTTAPGTYQRSHPARAAR